MVVLHLTKQEALFLQNRCVQARSVVYSNLREEAPRGGVTYEHLRDEAQALTALIDKLDKVSAQ